MKTGFLLTGLLLLFLANLFMIYSYRSGYPSGTSEGFMGYFLENAGASGMGNYLSLIHI